MESVTGGTGQGCLSLMRSRISLAETKPWIQFGSIFSALEWEGGGETLTWESMKLAWSPHRDTLVTKMRGGAGGSGGALGPRTSPCQAGIFVTLDPPFRSTSSLQFRWTFLPYLLLPLRHGPSYSFSSSFTPFCLCTLLLPSLFFVYALPYSLLTSNNYLQST